MREDGVMKSKRKNICEECDNETKYEYDDLCPDCRAANKDYETLEESLDIQEDPKRLKAALSKAGDKVEDAGMVMQRYKGMRGSKK